MFNVYRVQVYFQILISKITEQRQNFANSGRYTNEDAEINRSLVKVLHSSACGGRCSEEGVLRGGSVRGTYVCPDRGMGAFVDTTVIDGCRSVSTCGTDVAIGVDFKT